MHPAHGSLGPSGRASHRGKAKRHSEGSATQDLGGRVSSCQDHTTDISAPRWLLARSHPPFLVGLTTGQHTKEMTEEERGQERETPCSRTDRSRSADYSCAILRLRSKSADPAHTQRRALHEWVTARRTAYQSQEKTLPALGTAPELGKGNPPGWSD